MTTIAGALAVDDGFIHLQDPRAVPNINACRLGQRNVSSGPPGAEPVR
jgi:hypothetical protein